MDHDMLYIRKLMLYIGMNLFRHPMGVSQGLFTVHLDFQIDIDPVAEHSGTEHINAHHAALS